MKLLSIFAAVFVLSACASQPALSHREVEHIHSLKVVYLQPQYDLGMFDHSGSIGPATVLGITFGFIGGLTGSLVDNGISAGPNGNNFTDKNLSQYRDIAKSLDTRERLLAIATQAVAATPWLKGIPFEVVDQPVAADYPWQHTRDSTEDAIIYLIPLVGLDSYAGHLHVQFWVDVYANPHTRSPYLYDSAEFGKIFEQRVAVGDSGETMNSFYALELEQRLQMWFAGDGATLRGDIDPTLQDISAGLIHYLATDASAEPLGIGTAENKAQH